MAIIHASCVELDDGAVLLRGPSGAGKSDLALRLIDRGARLVADDRVDLTVHRGRLIARAPAAIAGLIEIRGIGLIQVSVVAEAVVALAVDLTPGAMPERMPEPSTLTLAGIDLPLIALDPFQASAAAKIRLALATLRSGRSLAGALGDRDR
jgi:serine kinase of HPr protein (carbohydrate metabolism regulator)